MMRSKPALKKDKFGKIYIYLLITIGILNILSLLLFLIFQNNFVNLFLIFASFLEIIPFLGSIGFIIYIFINKMKKILLSLPIFYLVGFISISIVGSLSIPIDGNFLNMNDMFSPGIIMGNLFFYAIQIALGIYLLKKKGLDLTPKRIKNKGKKTLGIVSIVLGVVSFIPLIGFFIGIIAVILGLISLISNRSKLGLIGLILGILGILTTIGFYGAIFYFGFVQEGGIFDELREESVSTYYLPEVINSIESYKIRYGYYPKKLEDISEMQGIVSFSDPIQVKLFRDINNTDLNYYYENHKTYYYLFSRGIDGIPFTEDDIFPSLGENPGNIGYRRPSDPPKDDLFKFNSMNKDEDILLVRVNDVEIYLSGILRDYERIQYQMQVQQTYEEILNQTIDKVVILQYAEDKGYSSSEEEVNNMLEDIKKMYGLDEEQLELTISYQNMTMKEYLEIIRQEIILNKVLEEIVLKEVAREIEESGKEYSEEYLDRLNKAKFREVMDSLRGKANIEYINNLPPEYTDHGIYSNNMASQETIEDWITNYYHNPTPEKVSVKIRQMAKQGFLTEVLDHSFYLAFFGEIFKQNSEKLEEWFFEDFKYLTDDEKTVLLYGLWYANTPESIEVLEKIREEDNSPHNKNFFDLFLTTKPEDPRITRIDDITILDILWGAYFASGDEILIQRIIETLPWTNEKPQLNAMKLRIGLAAKNDLNYYAIEDPKLIEIYKKELLSQSEEVKIILQRIIEDVEVD